MVAVRYQELADAFAFVSSAAPSEHQAYIDRLTGQILWASDAMEDEIPGDLDISDRYIAIPHQHDRDLGADLALQFAAEVLPHRQRRIQEFFRRRGAYARFKHLLAAEGRLEEWYAFEARCTETALRSWCEEIGVAVVDAGSST